jgi:hypothetical protein
MRWSTPDGIMGGENPTEGELTPMRSRPLPVYVAAFLLVLLSLFLLKG